MAVTLACLLVSGWLPAPAPLAFSAALLATAGLALLASVILPGVGRSPRRLHVLGRGRFYLMLAALLLALARALEPSGIVTAAAVAGGAQCGLNVAAIVVRILRTRPRADLVKRIGGRERARRARSFWFGRAPR
jgi:hypothetical protein